MTKGMVLTLAISSLKQWLCLELLTYEPTLLYLGCDFSFYDKLCHYTILDMCKNIFKLM
jgi:hypothetical protein